MMLKTILCSLTIGILGLFALFCILDPLFLGKRLTPHEFYQIGTDYLQKSMRSEGLDIDLRQWRCSLGSPEEAGFGEDGETYTVFYCGAMQDGKLFAFDAGLSAFGHRVWGDDNFSELLAQ